MRSCSMLIFPDRTFGYNIIVDVLFYSCFLDSLSSRSTFPIRVSAASSEPMRNDTPSRASSKRPSALS